MSHVRAFRASRISLALALLCLTSLAPAAGAETAPTTPFYLVGVGPGDPDLLTLRAVVVIGRADVVFCSKSWGENLASSLEGKKVYHDYWRLFPYYGKDPAQLQGKERQACEEVAQKRNEFIALVRAAVGQGQTVAVLDSGDPLIYGPCEWCLEEFEDLHPVVVPGVSSFNAGNAALRRGVTTSDHTKSVILTANDWPGKSDIIEKLAVHQSTMVLFTMRGEFKDYLAKLSVHYPPQTPVAVVKHAGSVGKEEVIQGTLGTIAERVGEDRLPFEYLLYVGDFLTHRYKKAPAAPAEQPAN